MAELNDFLGMHKLSGAEYGSIKAKDSYYDDPNVMYFVLDGVTYAVIEDPSDGYRSSMEEIVESDHEVTNRFKAQRVFGVRRESRYSGDYDIVDMYDVITAKRVLSFGTDHSDDYYPTFEAIFNPENMAINIDRGGNS